MVSKELIMWDISVNIAMGMGQALLIHIHNILLAV